MDTKIEFRENGVNIITTKKVGSKRKISGHFLHYTYKLKNEFIKRGIKLPFIGWIKVVDLRR